MSKNYIPKFDEKGVETHNTLKACIADQLIVDTRKTQQMVDVFTKLGCVVVDTRCTDENPHGFIIEMKGEK
jgi:hypothetical protein